MFESSSRSDSLKGLFARSKLKVCTLVRSAYCTSIIAPRRRRDASDNIERMAIAMFGCLPSGQVCRGRKPSAFESASAFGNSTIAAKPLISLGPSGHRRGPQAVRAREVSLGTASKNGLTGLTGEVR